MKQLSVALLISDRELSVRMTRALRALPVGMVTEVPDIGFAEEELIDSEMARSGAEVVFVEIGALGQRFPGIIRLIKSRPLPPAVVGICREADAKILLAAIRAGANDCLFLPLDEAALQEVVERLAAELRQAQPQPLRAKSVGFLSAAGGCGATTLACHFASELSRISGQNTLLADFDVRAGMVGFWMQVGNGYSIWDAASGLQRLDLSMWRGLVTTVQPGLDVASAPTELPADSSGDPEKLARVLRFTRSFYEWVVADLGAGLSDPAPEMLSELDALYLVSGAEITALYQARRILQKLAALGCSGRRIRLILNRLHKQHELRPEEIQKALGWRVDAVFPSDVPETEQALAERRLISRRSELGKRIIQLATKVTGEEWERTAGLRVPVSFVPMPVKASVSSAARQGGLRAIRSYSSYSSASTRDKDETE